MYDHSSFEENDARNPEESGNVEQTAPAGINVEQHASTVESGTVEQTTAESGNVEQTAPAGINVEQHASTVEGGNVEQTIPTAAPAAPEAQNPQRQAPQAPNWQFATRPPMPAQQTPRPAAPAPKRPKKPRLGLWVATVAICCGLLGSLCGGTIVGLAMRGRTAEPTTTEQPQQPTQNIQQVEQPTQEQQQTGTTTPLSSPKGVLTPSQVYAQNVSAVVSIVNESESQFQVFGQSGTQVSSGSGFLISSDGEILTNYHVVADASQLTVTLFDGRELEAEVLGYEAESDVALIKIEGSDLPTVTLGESGSLAVGDEVAAIGNPLGDLTNSLSVGYISSLTRYVSTDEMESNATPINMMQLDMAINSGNSGGPLFDMYGKVVGITSAKSSGTTGSGATIESIGFAIPIDDVMSMLDDLRENGTVLNRAYMGVSVRSVSDEEHQDGMPRGAYVASVVGDSGGWNAGLRRGDVITAIDGKTISSRDELSVVLKNYRGGDQAELTVYRDGETLTLQITFDAKPSTVEETEEPETEEEEFPFNPFDFLPGFGG